MDDTLAQVKQILTKFAKKKEALAAAGPDSRIREDLGVSSANVVDVLLEFEEKFNISISDDELEQIETVGNAVKLIEKKKSAA